VTILNALHHSDARLSPDLAVRPGQHAR
jgi:hypothetical protein